MFSLGFSEVDASLSSMCQILISFFKMDNVVFGSFAIKALSIVDTFLFIYYIMSTYVDSECIQNNQSSWILLGESYEHFICFVIYLSKQTLMDIAIYHNNCIVTLSSKFFAVIDIVVWPSCG